jgi:hypothetical protein
MDEYVKLPTISDYKPDVLQDSLICFNDASDEREQFKNYKFAMIHNLNVVERRNNPITHTIFIEIDRFINLDVDPRTEIYIEVYFNDLLLSQVNILSYNPRLYSSSSEYKECFYYVDDQCFHAIPINTYIPVCTPESRI